MVKDENVVGDPRLSANDLDTVEDAAKGEGQCR